MRIRPKALVLMAATVADAAIIKAGEMPGAVLFSTGRNGVAGVDAGPSKSQG